MESITPITSITATDFQPPASNTAMLVGPFSQEWVTITKGEHIDLKYGPNYWKAQHANLKEKYVALEDECRLRDAKIKDLQRRLFGRKSEKQGSAKSE